MTEEGSGRAGVAGAGARYQPAVVYHPGFDPDRLTELGLFARKGEQSRTAPVPMKLILVDSHTALIPSMRSYNPGHELRASIVRHSLLVEALQFLFEAVWDASVPILTSFSADNDPRRQMLVSLLMTGSTDRRSPTRSGSTCARSAGGSPS